MSSHETVIYKKHITCEPPQPQIMQRNRREIVIALCFGTVLISFRADDTSPLFKLLFDRREALLL